MLDRFDRRVLAEPALEFVRACQRRSPCRLGGGAALAGAWLAHRQSRDLGLFFWDRSQLRDLVRGLSSAAAEVGGEARTVRDAGDFVRARFELGGLELEVDLVLDTLPDSEPEPPPLEQVVLVPFADLRASKLTCLLSRAEPRDLVDVMFLERAGHPPESDLSYAAQKDAGLDPGVLSWLLTQFPVEPLPAMLVPITIDALADYRDSLAERLKALVVTSGSQE